MIRHDGVPARSAGAAKVLFAAGALLALAGCSQPAAPVAPPPPTVGVVESKRMSVPVLVTPNGTTRALENVTIRARVRGFLTERHFEEGAFVKKGQLLLVIDEEPYRVALELARAKEAEAAAALRKSEVSKGPQIARAQLELDRAQLVLAQIQEKRSRSLLVRSAGSTEELDKAEADRKKWEAQVVADQANLDQAQADFEVGIAAARAQVAAAKASVQDAELNLGYCRMFAPIDGRIGEAKVKVGNLVGPDPAGGGAFSDLATIQQLDPIGIDVRLSSRDLDRTRELIDRGLSVRLSRPGSAGDLEYAQVGTCYFIDNVIDETTSTFLAKARMPNPGGTLLPGEYVKLRLVVDQLDDAVVVPAPSVMETETGPVVHVVDERGKVAARQVAAAQTYEGFRVITRGLESGVPVIVEGLQSIRPGIQVKAEPVAASRAAEEAKVTATSAASVRATRTATAATAPPRS